MNATQTSHEPKNTDVTQTQHRRHMNTTQTSHEYNNTDVTRTQKAKTSHEHKKAKTSHEHDNKDPAESPAVTLAWHASKYKVHKLHQRYVL